MARLEGMLQSVGQDLRMLAQQQQVLTMQQAHFETYVTGRLDLSGEQMSRVSERVFADADDDSSRSRRRRRTMYQGHAFSDTGLMILGENASPQQTRTPPPPTPPACPRPIAGRGRPMAPPESSPAPRPADATAPTDREPRASTATGIGRDWFPAGSVAAFTGDVDVTSTCPTNNPLVWTREIRSAMLQRNIPEDIWPKKCVSCLARRVVDRFVASRAGSDIGAITQRFVGHAADPFANTTWDAFVDWMLHTYVTPSHVESMALQVERIRCRDVDHVEDFVADFNAATVAADYMSLVIIDRVPHGSPELADGIASAADTPERRRHFRAALPPAIQGVLNQAETTHRLEDPTWYYTLPTLQKSAVAHAQTLQAAHRRGETSSKPGPGTAHVHHMGADHTAGAPGSSTSVADDVADLRAQMAQLMHLCSTLDRTPTPAPVAAPSAVADDDIDDYDLSLFIRIADVMHPAPPDALIERRRQEGTCLACGEGHRWQSCPKIAADATMSQRLQEGLAADRARRAGNRRR